MTASALVCHGCRAAPIGDPFRCPNHGAGDVDHVLDRVLDASSVSLVGEGGDGTGPFVRHRRMLHTYHASGLSDAAYVDLACRLAAGIAETPFAPDGRLSAATGADVWVKDERGALGGSHKARHLMAIALYLDARGDRRELAIASCGNAAIAAATIAAPAGRSLTVFVPPEADAAVLARLEHLGARVEVCARTGVGDPSYAALLRAVDDGAVPFTCQGDQNALGIDGGATLGYEMVATQPSLDHVVVQVGGGALASSVIRAFDDAFAVGAIAAVPRIHAVQTAGGHPLERAYRLVRARAGDQAEALGYAAGHRSEFMWPWEELPSSIATGILDDETYDWWAVVRGLLRSGGQPVVVTEDQLAHAVELTANTASATGAAGLAGVVVLRQQRVIKPGERVAVVLTGAGAC